MAAMKFRGARVASLLLACTLALSACSDDGDKDTKSSNDSTPSESSTTGVELTAPGSKLELGETATVAWAPNQKLASTIAVTINRIDRGPARDFRAVKVDPPLNDPKLYYVWFTLENEGDTQLGGLSSLMLPIYLDDGSSILKPAADVRVRFSPCPLKKLPAKFGEGRKTVLCLVYAVEADLANISLRPDDTSELITWTGEITKPGKPRNRKR
jgi:hypothetical protein